MRRTLDFFHRYFYFVIAVYFGALFFIFKGDYFFGDSISSTSRLATHIYETGICFYPEGFDPGHPPLYSLLLCGCWMICGKTLAVSHAFGMVWCLFLLLGFRKLCTLFLDRNYTNYASLLVMVHPTFISQNAMMLNTAMLMAAFLWALYFLLKSNTRMYVLLLIIMVLSHLQGAFFLASLAVTDFIIHRKEVKLMKFLSTKFIVYSIPFLLFSAWLILHYRHAGWLLVSPDYTDTHETNSMLQIVKGVIYCFWRFLDYGMIAVFLVYATIKYRHRRFYMYDAVFWITFSVTTIIMSFVLKNTIAHRYFLALELFFMLIVVIEIKEYSKLRVVNYLVLMIALLCGNFIYYPGKTIADANIQYRGFFKSYNNLMENISDTTIAYSKAPIANEYKYLNIQSGNREHNHRPAIRRINEALIDTLPCILSSNVCAEFNKDELDKLSSWYGKSYENGAVYINLYLNPAFNVKHADWHIREAGSFEKWMIRMKKKFK